MKNAAMWLVVPALLAACGGPGDTDTAVSVTSSDVRIDGEFNENDPESSDAKMCVNEDGHIFVLWQDTRDGQPDIWFNRSLDNGTSWLPTPVKVNRGDSNIWAPDIACVDQNVYVVWEDDRDGELQNHQIYFSRSNDGGETWLEEDVVLEDDEEGDTMSLGPDVTAVGDDVYVAWFDNLNGAYDIYVAATEDNGVTWGSPVRVDSDDPAGIAYSAWPRIAATEEGNVYVVWEDSRNGAADIYFARSDNKGGTFKEDERLDGGDDAGSHNSFSPYMSADGNSIYVVWHDERNGDGRDVFLNFSGNGGADWSDPATRIDSDNAGFFNSLFPVVVADGATGHVAWQDNREAGYDIFYRAVESGVPVGDEEVRVDVGDEPGFNNSVNPDIALGEGGVVVVAWEDARGEAVSGLDEGYNDLYYNFTDGGAFSEEDDLRIDSMAEGESFKIDLNVAVHGGWLFSTWVDGRNGTSDVYFHALTVGEEATYIPVEDAATAQ